MAAVERFQDSNSNQHPKDYVQFTINFGTISNILMPINNQVLFILF